MSELSDEEFDVDFVSNAVRNVKKKWQQIEETKDELKDVTNTNVFAEGEGIKRRRRYEISCVLTCFVEGSVCLSLSSSMEL